MGAVPRTLAVLRTLAGKWCRARARLPATTPAGGDPVTLRTRRILAASVTLLALGTLAACSTDTVQAGPRPHRPSSTTAPSANPQTDPAKLALDVTTLPSWTAATTLSPGTYQRRLTDADGTFTWQVLDAQGRVIPNYQASDTVAWGDPSTYSEIPGVLTFRGNNYRSGGAYGAPVVTNRKLEVVWKKQIGEIRGEGSYWPGAGWTGQPLLVQWPRATKEAMGLSAAQVADDTFVEVIYPVFEGKIHRLALADGTPTKDPITVGWGFKGTGSIDPRGYPLLYAGQGLNDTNGTIGPWGFRMFDLIRNREVARLDGLDPDALRQDWGAFDSSALVNRQTDTLVEPGENGLIYRVKLNATFDAAARRVSIDPQVTKLRFDTTLSKKHGTENSAVAYRNLMFAVDNDGNLFCWDVNTLQILWMRTVGDDTDASLGLDATADGVFLYTGNEVDNRGESGGERIANIRKVDALSGRQVWQYDIPAYYDPNVNGGVLGSPIIGHGATSDLVIFNVARTTAPREGDLVALDKASGAVVWRRHLTNYSWSSPTLITAADGVQYVVLPDSDGVLHLIDPQTGLDLSSVGLGGKNTEATVSVFGNMMVVASYDRNIYGIRIS